MKKQKMNSKKKNKKRKRSQRSYDSEKQPARKKRKTRMSVDHLTIRISGIPFNRKIYEDGQYLRSIKSKMSNFKIQTLKNTRIRPPLGESDNSLLQSIKWKDHQRSRKGWIKQVGLCEVYLVLKYEKDIKEASELLCDIQLIRKHGVMIHLPSGEIIEPNKHEKENISCAEHMEQVEALLSKSNVEEINLFDFYKRIENLEYSTNQEELEEFLQNSIGSNGYVYSLLIPEYENSQSNTFKNCGFAVCHLKLMKDEKFVGFSKLGGRNIRVKTISEIDFKNIEIK